VAVKRHSKYKRAYEHVALTAFWFVLKKSAGEEETQLTLTKKMTVSWLSGHSVSSMHFHLVVMHEKVESSEQHREFHRAVPRNYASLSDSARIPGMLVNQARLAVE
jgi:diadenosine tetraphosphate (Ap4A) HIT family hydrolase